MECWHFGMKYTNEDAIPLRIFAFHNSGRWKMICLDTDIAVAASTWEEVEQKMKDASLLYFRSFTKEQLRNQEYLRKAPLKYQAKYWLNEYIIQPLHLTNGPLMATYDVRTSGLSFA